MPASKVQKAFLYRLFSRYFKIFLVLVIIMILVISYFTLIGPKLSEAKRAKNIELRDKTILLASRESYLQDLKTLTSSYKKLSDTEIERINLILPSEEDFPEIFTQIEALVEKNGVFLQAIDISRSAVELNKENKLPKDVRRLEVSLSLAGGDYDIFKKLLDDFEFNIRIFDISSVSFTPDFTSSFVVLSAYYTE